MGKGRKGGGRRREARQAAASGGRERRRGAAEGGRPRRAPFRGSAERVAFHWKSAERSAFLSERVAFLWSSKLNLAKRGALGYDPAMFWLRWIFFSSPLLLGLGGFWLVGRIADLSLREESDALVHAIDDPVGYLSPVTPGDGIEGEIADLIFEPLLIRDEKFRLRPNLLESWSARTISTLLCESEEAAGEAEARIRAGEAPVKGTRPLAVEREGELLTVAFEGLDEDVLGPMLEALPKSLMADSRLVRVRADHSVEALVSVWMETSRERERLRLVEFTDGRVADLFVVGEVAPLLEELRHFFAANAATHPRAELVGERHHHSSREMVLDLHRGVSWHDGTPFSAKDLLFSYRFLTGPDSPRSLAAAFDFVASLEALSPHRLKVVCREAPATMLESWERLPVLPAHRLEARVEKDPAAAFAEFFTSPVGLGPYRLERRRADGGVELRANAAYHRGAPREALRRYRHFSSLESTLLAVRTGGLHAIEPDRRFTEWTARHPGLVTTLRDLPELRHLVVWNLDRSPFDRVAVRQALARSVDLGRILEDRATRFETPVTSLFHPASNAAAEALLLPLYDPRGAERLLERQGYRFDETTRRCLDEQGEELAFTLSVSEANPEHRRLAAALSESWGALGIEVRVEAVGWSELLDERIPRRDFDAVIVSWAIPLGRDRREFWHSSAAVPGGGNLSGLRDAEVDALLEDLRREDDPAKATAAAAALQRAIAERQACLFLCDTGRIVTLRTGALAEAPPGEAETRPIDPAAGGLAASRPWWVRLPPPLSPP